MKIEEHLNQIMHGLDEKKLIDTNLLSDGVHTFGELYDHRAKLFSVICNLFHDISWKSKFHDDGSMFEGYFIVGIDTPKGQATYHYGLCYWDLFDVVELERAPKYDGHTSNQAIERIQSLGKSDCKQKNLGTIYE